MTSSNIKNSIKGWFFTSDEILQAITESTMLNPSIDLTNACNLNCPYCYIEEKNSTRKQRKPNELTYSETILLIDELASCGARTINMVGAGEPTVDENFEDIVRYIYTKGITTVLFTNGIMLAKRPLLIDFLYKHDVSIMLKYNAVSATIQDMVAGKKGYTEKRNKALELLIKAGFNNESPTRLGVDIISFRGNVTDIPKIHLWCRERNIYPIAGDYIPTGRTDNGIFTGEKSANNFSEIEVQKINKLLQPITTEERFWLITQLGLIDNKFGIQRDGCFAYFGGSICTQIMGLYIDIEGNIWPCIARKKSADNQLINGLLGNIRQRDSVKKIWQEDSYIRNLRITFNGGCPYKPKLTNEYANKKNQLTVFQTSENKPNFSYPDI